MSLDIRHQDAHIVVVNKPFGLPTQGTQKPNQDHLFAQVKARFPTAALHHRLDTPASGLVLFTVHPSANKGIAAAFQGRRITRRYLAMVAGDPGPDGTWSAGLDGKTAITRFVRIGSEGGMSLLEVQIETGRTHQIRRHASDSGYPILGDKRYGSAAGGLWPRLALHAVSLQLKHPISGEPITVSSPVPSDLTTLMNPLCPELDRRYSPETAAG
jgi:RluA family pseudouridine synthase